MFLALNRFSIRFKFLSAFSIMLLLLLGLSATALNRLSAINDRAADIRDNWLPKTGDQGRLLVAMQKVRILEARYAIALTDGDRRQIGSMIVEGRSGVNRIRTSYESLTAQGTTEARLMRTLDQKWAAHTSAVDHDIGAGGDSENLFGEEEQRSFDHAFEASKAAFDMSLLEGRKAAEASASVYAMTKRVILAVSAAAIVACALLALAIIRNVSTPIRRITDVMKHIADHDLQVEMVGLGRRDEIGGIAGAIQVFRDNMIERDRLASEQDAEQSGKAQRAVRLDGLVGGFESKIGEMVSMLAAASTEMEATAQAMSTTAVQTNEQASIVASAAEMASISVQTVAAAAEQLSSSITEISRQVTHSAHVSENAVAEASRTDAVVCALAGEAQKIGEVVNLITNIASQINLLALNATIEAARAGDAGKAFAVVASEVKNLAQQTTKATDEISTQINRVQAATTEVVKAIRSISMVIEEIGTIATMIAAAVEEQGVATAEIAHNVQRTAASTQTVTGNIASVSKAANETGTTASQVLDAASGLSRQAEGLSGAVGRFVTEIRAA